MSRRGHIFFSAHKGVWAVFKISEHIKHKDRELYAKLKKMANTKDNISSKDKPQKDVKLGDKPENLMRHDSYKRIGRRIKQVGWGGK